VQRQDTPNDPSYDQSEPDTQQPPANRSSNFYDERFDLFGFPSQLTPNAVYSVGPDRGQADGRRLQRGGRMEGRAGRPDAAVAILDTGIDWSQQGLRDKVPA